MSTLTKKLRTPLTLLLVLAMLVPLFQSIKVFAAYETIYYEGFESGADDWSMPYGATMERTTEASSNGEYSLKMTNRQNAWQSPAKNIYSIVRGYGAGRYRISMRVMTTAVVPEGRKIGMLIRTTEENSFSKMDPAGNYFYSLYATFGGVSENNWMTLSGMVNVLDSDIQATTGTFNLMIDTLNPADGQAVYIDEVYIQKQLESDALIIDKTWGSLCIGDTMKITANKTSGVSFNSTNESVATVNSNGEVTAVSAGRATIEVTYGSQKRICAVKVEPRYHVLADGMYLVRNTDKGIFMQVPEDDIANENAAVNLLEYNGGTQQHWEISYAGSGYYKIINKRSGKVLSVQDNSANEDNKNLVQKTYTGAYEQKWQIIPLGDGNYKFKPKSSEAYSSDWCAAANGKKVQQRQFVESGTNKYIGEWTLFDMAKPSITFTSFYDRAFNERYGATGSAMIQQSFASLQQVFLREFNVWIMCRSNSYELSFPDTECYPEYNKACDHASVSECTNDINSKHHKNLYYITKKLASQKQDISNREVHFTGHNTCIRLTTTDDYVNWVLGLTDTLKNVSVIADHKGNPSFGITLVHEYCHMYGAQDHYGSPKSTIEMNGNSLLGPYSSTCIYGENKASLTSPVICKGCKADIQAGINEAMH